ncbi:MAG: transposase [Saprospiraceae bacterium]|nr:transposase [Saprospiraceae bacterium]MBL0024996.1 transposase [Saprospiraceae bacterium]
MGTHRKTWSKSEKLAVISKAKAEGVLEASRHYEVSTTSIYKWLDKVESIGESSLEGLHAPELRRENKKLIAENKQLKEMNADKELKIMLMERLLKKSNYHGREDQVGTRIYRRRTSAGYRIKALDDTKEYLLLQTATRH